MAGSESAYANATTATQQWVQSCFQEKLASIPELRTEVVGFRNEQTLGLFFARQPIDIFNLFNAKMDGKGRGFERNFHPTLLCAINEIKSDEVRKEELHQALLNKYLGININDPKVQDFKCDLKPNAFRSVPDVDQEEDYFLHLYFVQPFRLFSITPDDRKWVSSSDAKCNREWLWFNHADSDAAPMFREIIQLYIVSAILEDYAEKNEYCSKAIRTKLPQLEALYETLQANIKAKLDGIFESATLAYNAIPEAERMELMRGWLPDPYAQRLAEYVPDFLDISSFYPIGRLILGQPRAEPHHLLAQRGARHGNKFWHAIKYTFHWLYAHLNVSTSAFWIKTCLGIALDMYGALKKYITKRDSQFIRLFVSSLIAIPGLFLLAASPLLIVFPWVYGLTSIPFSLWRSFCISGPFRILKNGRVLQFIDMLELLKDAFLFFLYIVPALNMMLAVVNAFIPPFLMSIGIGVSFSLLTLLYVAVSDVVIDYDVWVGGLSNVANTHFFRFFGSSLAVCLGAYLGIGVVGRQIYPWLPAFPERGSRLFASLFRPFRALSPHSEIPKNEVKMVIPDFEKAIQIPKIKRVQLSAEQEAERVRLGIQLGQLNQAVNLIGPQKEQIRECLRVLDPTGSFTSVEIQAAMTCASVIVDKAAIPPEHMGPFRELVKKLPKGGAEFPNDRTAIIVAGTNKSYMPSFALVQALDQNHLLDTASGVDENIRDRCHAILHLAPC